MKNNSTEFYSLISNPAKRAIDGVKIKKLQDFTKYTKEEIANLHGIGPKALTVIEKYLKKNDLSFKKK